MTWDSEKNTLKFSVGFINKCFKLHMLKILNINFYMCFEAKELQECRIR